MIKLIKLLLEQEMSVFQGYVKVHYTEGMNATEITDIIRAIEGVTIVDSKGDNDDTNNVVLLIKIRTISSGQNAGLSAFEKVKQKAIKFNGILRVDIATKTIEEIL